jgi:hypothetical protein
MTAVAENADFKFTKLTVGLPDHVFLDEKGCLSSTELKKHINIL